MPEARTETTKPRAKSNGRSDPESLERAKTAMHQALDEAWEPFQAALHETVGSEPASITVALRYKPGKDGKRKQTPPRVEVVGKSNLPTNKEVFTARISGGQLSLSLGFDA